MTRELVYVRVVMAEFHGIIAAETKKMTFKVV